MIAGYESELARAAAARCASCRRRGCASIPTLESANLFVPGLIALVLTLVSALMTAISLSREKERGTLEVLLVSPLRPWQIIVGKVLPYLGLAFANVLTALLAARLVFHVPFRGSLTLLLAESMLYIPGVARARRARSRRARRRSAPRCSARCSARCCRPLLSGMIFPIASMPALAAAGDEHRAGAMVHRHRARASC